MKSTLKILGLTCLLFLAFACSQDDDTADSDIFVGTYEGNISFTDGDGDAETHENGKVTVFKRGSRRYDINFSDSISNLNEIKLEEKGDHTIHNVDVEEGMTYS